jgi:hypothetical protein
LVTMPGGDRKRDLQIAARHQEWRPDWRACCQLCTSSKARGRNSSPRTRWGPHIGRIRIVTLRDSSRLSFAPWLPPPDEPEATRADQASRAGARPEGRSRPSDFPKVRPDRKIVRVLHDRALRRGQLVALDLADDHGRAPTSAPAKVQDWERSSRGVHDGRAACRSRQLRNPMPERRE